MNHKLIEICVLCGFVHRDDRTKTRQRKPHFHWTPKAGEETVRGSVIHATVCVACLSHPVDWTKYALARAKTDDLYYIPDSFNATLPVRPTALLSRQYARLCEALKDDSKRW